MTSVVAVLVCFGVYFAGYVFYSRYLAQEVFALRADFVTPAHALEDGVDYVPTRPVVLFGHHFASITGLKSFCFPGSRSAMCGQSGNPARPVVNSRSL